jgi:hypothetical protein
VTILIRKEKLTHFAAALRCLGEAAKEESAF